MKIIVKSIFLREIEVDDKFKAMNAFAKTCDTRWDALADELEAIVKTEVSNPENTAVRKLVMEVYERGSADDPMLIID